VKSMTTNQEQTSTWNMNKKKKNEGFLQLTRRKCSISSREDLAMP